MLRFAWRWAKVGDRMLPLLVHPDPLDSEEACWICDRNMAVEKAGAT